MRSRLAGLSVLLAFAVSIAACGSSSSSSSTSSTTSSTAAPSPTTAAPTTKPTTSSKHCSTEQLKASLGETQGGAGQRYTVLILTNSGSAACELRGFPGVSLLDSAGKQLGQPATREGTEGALVTLAPGGTASTTLRTSAQGTGAACEPTSTQLRVFPPDNTAALTFSAAYVACGGFRVSTLVAGSAGN